MCNVNKFKVGDVVKCVDTGIYNNLTVGKEYKLVDVVIVTGKQHHQL